MTEEIVTREEQRVHGRLGLYLPIIVILLMFGTVVIFSPGKTLNWIGVILAFLLLGVHYRAENSRTKKLLELQQKSRMLCHNEAQLRSIFRAAPVGIGTVSDRTIIDVNNRMCEILGYTREDLLGKSARLLYTSEKEYLWVGKEKYEQIRKQGMGTVETQWVRKDGRILDVLLSSSPFHTDDLKAGVTFTILDITQRKQSEMEMKRLRNLLKNMTDSMPTVLAAVDQMGMITLLNREAARVAGLKQEEAIGLTLMKVFPQLLFNIDNLHNVIRDGEIRIEEKVCNTCDGKVTFSDVTVYPLIVNEIIEGAVIRLDDVTERMNIQEMMIHSEKMRSVGGLAAGMAHEINNPLAGIMQNIQVLRNRLKSDLPKNKRIAEKHGTAMETIENYMEERGILAMIEAILSSGRRAREIVDNLVNFSRKSESKFAPHQLAELMDQTIELAASDYDLKKKYDFRKIKICRQYETGMPDVRCESTRMQQVFLNLLKNGAQTMSEDPEKREREKPRLLIRIHSNKEENMAQIEVEDNGAGMNEEISKRIFEPFFTTREAGLGSGLGLSISYFIITQTHAGKMKVESFPGKGTTFSILLPWEGREQSGGAQNDSV
ncbi:MAG: PAS domain S-box protein [bacterium]|nr:PAS domain S-box protein [bacterium]